MNASQPLPERLVLFDGVCKFCNSSINLVIRNDRRDRFRFTPFQSELGQVILQQFDLNQENLQSVILIEHGRAYTKSTAALRIARRLDGLWPGMYAFILVPPFIRDWIYDWIARNRYRWWGKMDACMVPTPEVRKKFMG
jgi:predicted DCC family thiol-disulfide oxidoreductase YuxK